MNLREKHRGERKILPPALCLRITTCLPRMKSAQFRRTTYPVKRGEKAARCKVAAAALLKRHYYRYYLEFGDCLSASRCQDSGPAILLLLVCICEQEIKAPSSIFALLTQARGNRLVIIASSDHISTLKFQHP